MQWMAIWMHPLSIQAMEVVQAGLIRVLTTDYKPYHYDMGEAKKTFRLDNTSILYIYKVFKHPPIQWMAIWMHP